MISISGILNEERAGPVIEADRIKGVKANNL
jgi:hypothetical protein